jgi:hypothetical protein
MHDLLFTEQKNWGEKPATEETDQTDNQPQTALVTSPTTVTVTIVKFINGQHATSELVSGESFPMSSTWSTTNIGSGTGTYNLGPSGFNNPNSYEATTSAMSVGASYTTSETLGGTLGTTCASGESYRLLGYTVGDNLEQADNSAGITTEAPALDNIQSDKYIVVWNEVCEATTQTGPTFHFMKLVCSTYSDIAGNEAADGQDDTQGNYSSFSNYSASEPHFGPYPNKPINPAEVPDNSCSPAAGWEFRMYGGESSTVITTDPTGSDGMTSVAFSALPAELQTVVNDKGSLRAYELAKNGYGFGAFRCYKDALFGDNSEIIDFSGDETLPTDVYCIAYNVLTQQTEQDPTGPTFNFMKLVCSAYSDIAGNESADGQDDTQGNYVSFSNYSASDPHFGPYEAKPVNPSEVPDNSCSPASGWRFNMYGGPSSTVVTTDPTNSEGVTSISFASLPAALQDVVNSRGTLRTYELTQAGYGFGTFRCYKDALFGDNSEIIDFSGDETLPTDVYCIAYNVLSSGGGSENDGGSISGVKFFDNNQDGKQGEGDNGIAGWTINLIQGESVVATTTTDESGNYSFTNLSTGTYLVCEELQSGWTQTMPVESDICGDNGNGYTVVINAEQLAQSGLDFGNHRLVISEEQTHTTTTTQVTITWTTNHPATSRVVYDTVSHDPVGSNSCPSPYEAFQCYGYALTTAEDSTMTTSHSMVIAGLNSGTTYYFRPVSHGSPEVTGIQLVVTTNSPGGGGGGCFGSCATSFGGGGGNSTPPNNSSTPGSGNNGSNIPQGLVLGDSTNVPSNSSDPQGQVLGTTTELPRTGNPIPFVVLLAALALSINWLRQRKLVNI